MTPRRSNPPPKEDRLKLGRELRELREELGISQSKLAAKAEIAQNTLSQFESGKRKFSGESLQRVLEAISDIRVERKAAVAAAPSKLVNLADLLGGPATRAAFTESYNRVAAEWGSYKNFKAFNDSCHRIAELEREVSKLQDANKDKEQLIQAKQELIDRLKDLLDLKTKEVLLRDKIETESKPAKGSLSVAGMRKENAEGDE